MTKEIYLDYGAAAPIDPRVVREVRLAEKLFANPSSFNNAGRMSRTALSEARQKVAKFLGARSEEIIFTSSGSEANSLAIEGFLRALSSRKKHRVLTTPIEHKSVLATLEKLQKEKFIEVDFLPVDREGKVKLEDVKKMISKDTRLVSVMYVNNEIGTIQSIVQIGKIIREFRRLPFKGRLAFHVDSCQAAAHLPMNIQRMGADLVTFNGSKIYGPRGVGVLFKSRHVPLKPLLVGGGQEGGLRSGTENLPGIVGLAKAVELISPRSHAKLAALQKYLIESIQRDLPEATINGPLDPGIRAPHNVHLSFPGLTSEQVLIELDKHSVRAGSGSACTARSVEPSHVLTAINLPRSHQRSGIRLTIGRWTTQDELGVALKALARSVQDLKKRYNVGM